jgi:hypothetical protein
MLPFLAPLFALQLEDLIKVIVPIVFFLVWLFNRLFAGEGAQQQQRPKVRRAEPPQPKPVPVERQRVEDEVGEFLRRAQQQRTAGQAQAAPQRLAEPIRPQPAPVVAEVVPVEVEVVEEQRLGGGVAAHVEQRIASRRLRERAKGEVEQADEAMASHLHQAFDHKLGQLAGLTTTQTATTTPATTTRNVSHSTARVAELLSQLRNPATVGNAIIVSEVLRRPEERW